MPNLRIASRYAKSLVDLATEKGALENVYADMQFLKAVTGASKDFVNLLRSPVIKADKKQAIINAVVNGKTGEITTAFIKLLINKGREADLPEIIAAFIDQYNAVKGIHIVQLTTAVEVDDTIKQRLVSQLKADTGFTKVELQSKVNPDLIGGFVLEYNNNLIDASILRDLKDIKKQFSTNLFVHNIR
ncbi:ATP synthase F1 subunit delta [Deminuibacter soli]|uniref:ATP synthase subunit delta n=1 Tax=Deminuibacter soli TaxID=2291815 RepID=A0A3E1NPG4_9BACT|nr:ATP synthase F1 subunit delta [Deminuibacter soli]RFM29821.1 F0F1 ATP synthase subunit delta [Deminuibacter soli]